MRVLVSSRVRSRHSAQDGRASPWMGVGGAGAGGMARSRVAMLRPHVLQMGPATSPWYLPCVGGRVRGGADAVLQRLAALVEVEEEGVRAVEVFSAPRPVLGGGAAASEQRSACPGRPLGARASRSRGPARGDRGWLRRFGAYSVTLAPSVHQAVRALCRSRGRPRASPSFPRAVRALKAKRPPIASPSFPRAARSY